MRASPRLVRLAQIALILLLARGLVWLLTGQPFNLHTFQVNGLRTLTAREVVVQSGLEGVNIFSSRPAEAAALVQDLPSVKSARVRLRVPDFAVIEVQERHPILLWQSGGTLYGVDGEGVVIPPTGAWEGALTLVALDGEPLKMGSRVDGEVLAAALQVQRRVPGVRTLEYGRAEGLILRTPQGWPVYLGLADGLEFKLKTLEALLADLTAGEGTVRFIDLRLPTHPIVALQ